MASSRSRILCVDDEQVGLKIRLWTLESQGYEVCKATNGTEAIEMFSKEHFDLVILDYSMPGMNGGQVAAALRAQKSTVPIILLSAYVALPEEHVTLANLYLTKGESTTEFLAHVKELVDGDVKNTNKEIEP